MGSGARTRVRTVLLFCQRPSAAPGLRQTGRSSSPSCPLQSQRCPNTASKGVQEPLVGGEPQGSKWGCWRLQGGSDQGGWGLMARAGTVAGGSQSRADERRWGLVGGQPGLEEAALLQWGWLAKQGGSCGQRGPQQWGWLGQRSGSWRGGWRRGHGPGHRGGDGRDLDLRGERRVRRPGSAHPQPSTMTRQLLSSLL